MGDFHLVPVTTDDRKHQLWVAAADPRGRPPCTPCSITASVVIAPSFGDIFAQNAKTGLLTAVLGDAETAALISAAERDPASIVTVDLMSQSIACGEAHFAFVIDPPAATACSMGGTISASLTRFARRSPTSTPPIASGDLGLSLYRPGDSP